MRCGQSYCCALPSLGSRKQRWVWVQQRGQLRLQLCGTPLYLGVEGRRSRHTWLPWAFPNCHLTLWGGTWRQRTPSSPVVGPCQCLWINTPQPGGNSPGKSTGEKSGTSFWTIVTDPVCMTDCLPLCICSDPFCAESKPFPKTFLCQTPYSQISTTQITITVHDSRTKRPPELRLK